MGQRLLVCALVAVAGCARTVPAEMAAVDPAHEIGRTHAPYRGKPFYLAANGPFYAEARAAAADPCRTRSPGCDGRLRAELAALDGEILALGEPPTEMQLRALALTVQNLTPLLQPYPDLLAQQRELAQLVAELPTLPVARQGEVRRRMVELSDLLRVQLAASK